MNTITIFQMDDNTFTAWADGTNDEMHNLTGSIFELWQQASDLIRVNDQDIFRHNQFSYQSNDFTAEWNEDLEGYELIFSDGSFYQTQTDSIESRNLIEFQDNEGKITEAQMVIAQDFMDQVNELNEAFGY